MALSVPKPVVATSTSSPGASPRVGSATRVGSNASQPDFQVPEIDATTGVGARAPDTDPNAGWKGPFNEEDNRRRQDGGKAGRTEPDDRTGFRPTTVADVIMASEIVADRLGPPPTRPNLTRRAVAVYETAIHAVRGTLPRSLLGAHLNVAL